MLSSIDRRLERLIAQRAAEPPVTRRSMRRVRVNRTFPYYAYHGLKGDLVAKSGHCFKVRFDGDANPEYLAVWHRDYFDEI